MMERKYEDKLEELLKDQDNISYFINIINNELWCDSDKRKELLECVISFSEKNDLDIAKAWMYYYLAWHYSEEGYVDKSIDLLKITRDIFDYYDIIRGILLAYNGLIYMCCDMGQYEIANEYGNIAIAIAEEKKEDDILLKILLSTSITNMYAGDYAYAREILNIINRKFNIENSDEFHKNDKIEYYKALIEIELNLGVTDGILDKINIAEKLSIETKEKQSLAELFKLRGLYYSTINEFDKADMEFEKSDVISVENKYFKQKCENNIYWAKHKFKMGNYEVGVKLLKETYNISKVAEQKKILKIVSDMLYKYFKGTGDNKKALFYLDEYMQEEINYNNPVETKSDGIINRKYSREINLINIINNKTEIIYKIGKKIISSFCIKKIISETESELKKLLNFDFFGIIIYNSKKEEVDLISLEVDQIEEKKSIKLSPNVPFCYDCIKNKKIVVINDIEEALRDKKDMTVTYEGYGIEHPLSGVFVPLKYKDEVIGAMYVESFERNAYSADDINILKLIANYITISVRNAIKYNIKEKEASYDGTTGYLTKRKIIDKLSLEINSFKDNGNIFSIAMIDMDNLKNINDNYGHSNGDIAIIEVTKAIKKFLRKTDYIGRYGGDEFLLVSSGVNKNDLEHILNLARKKVASMDIIINNGYKVSSTISAGIYEYNRKDVSIEKAIESADKALYEAKKNNKNSVIIYKELD